MTKAKSNTSTKKAKIVVAVVMCLISVIALFFGVVSCLPDGIEYGTYGEYHAPVNLIQKSGAFGDSIVATYDVKLDKDAKMDDVVTAVRTRLANMYGYYFCDVKDVSADGINRISVTVPKTAKSDGIRETQILSSLTQKGKVEILTESTYAADKAILTSEHVKRMSSRSFVDGGFSYYVIKMVLTKEGQKIAEKELTVSSSFDSAYLFIDGASDPSGRIAYDSNGNLQVFAGNNAQLTQQIMGLVKSGALSATLTQDVVTDKPSYGALIFGIVMCVLIVGTWIFYAVRYKTMGLAVIIAQLVAVVVCMLFMGLVYFNYLNTASAIGLALGFILMSVFSCLVLEKLRKYQLDEKTFASARFRAFHENNMWNGIVHAIVLVVGIILWVIPTGVTAPLGNALVYTAVLSCGVTMGLNRWFTSLMGVFVAETDK